ncbi:General transcription factor II-I repeat domain-containing protein 2, partial [Camponotus floridanus]
LLSKSFKQSLSRISIVICPKLILQLSDISNSVREKLRNLLKSCRYFSLYLDESTDIRHLSQLSIFTRIVQDDFSCVEELLDFVSLHDTTTGLDIFLAVEDLLKKFDVDFNKCSSIMTDGAK